MATTTTTSSSELPNNTTSATTTTSRPSLVRPHIVTNGLGGGPRNRIVDTIHNNKNSLAQEVIYEVEASSNTSPMTTVSIVQYFQKKGANFLGGTITDTVWGHTQTT